MRWALACLTIFTICLVQRFALAEQGDDGTSSDRLSRKAKGSALSDEQRLAALYHTQWVQGRTSQALAGLTSLLDDKRVAPIIRARAGMRVAQITELAGDKRRAAAALDLVVQLAPQGSRLARLAADRRERIRRVAPLAEIRGPVPGSVTLAGESPSIVSLFRRAEKALIACHRVVVAPRLENIDEVLWRKRRAGSAAIALYSEVAERGGPEARAAAHFRLAALHHHLAEAMAFERPRGMLPSVAVRLGRRLRAESVASLHRSLLHYRAVVSIRESRPLWRRLAAQEVRTLEQVLGRQARQSGK